MSSIFSFSPREVKDILISLLVLTIVFAYPEFLFNPVFLLFSLLSVGIAFIGHELSHRFYARRLGFFSEYRMWKQGLLMAFFFAIISGGRFIFAAPGAVVFSGHFAFRGYERKDVGKIGIAGCVFNITLLYICSFLYLLSGFFLFQYIALINGWLGIFNLIPFGPLDGRKVMQWDWRIWLITFLMAIIGFLALYAV